MIEYIDTVTKSHDISLGVELKSVGVLTFSEDPNDICWLYHVVANDEWRDYYIVYSGPVDATYRPVISYPADRDSIPIRIDSGCITGMTFGDKSCECKDQLDEAIRIIRDAGMGFVVHIPAQDGRGMGIDFKLHTLRRQSIEGCDTVKAARLTAGSHNIDRRTYYGAIASLKLIGLDNTYRLDIATNNPDKVASFVNSGFIDLKETPIRIAINDLTKKHLAAKKKYLRHKL